MDIMDFITENAILMIPALWIIGEFIKDTQFIKDKYIPSILLIMSLCMTPVVLGGFTPENIVQAILVAGASVLSNEMVKQYNKPE